MTDSTDKKPPTAEVRWSACDGLISEVIVNGRRVPFVSYPDGKVTVILQHCDFLESGHSR